MTDFVLAISRIVKDTEKHIDLNCIYADSIPLGVKCTKDVKKLRADALNKLTEALVEKCGGKNIFILTKESIFDTSFMTIFKCKN